MPQWVSNFTAILDDVYLSTSAEKHHVDLTAVQLILHSLLERDSLPQHPVFDVGQYNGTLSDLVDLNIDQYLGTLSQFAVYWGDRLAQVMIEVAP